MPGITALNAQTGLQQASFGLQVLISTNTELIFIITDGSYANFHVLGKTGHDIVC